MQPTLEIIARQAERKRERERARVTIAAATEGRRTKRVFVRSKERWLARFGCPNRDTVHFSWLLHRKPGRLCPVAGIDDNGESTSQPIPPFVLLSRAICHPLSELAPPRFVIYGFRLINFHLRIIRDTSEIVRVKRRQASPADTRFATRFYNAISIVKSRGEWTNNNVRERKFFYKNLLEYLDSSRRDRWNKIKSLRRIVHPSRGGTKGYPLEGRERGTFLRFD